LGQRAAKVPKEQIDYQLGHVQQGAPTTQDYGQYEVGYLSEATTALNAWIGRVLKLSRKLTAKARLAPEFPQTGLAANYGTRKCLKNWSEREDWRNHAFGLFSSSLALGSG
jgi:hypothetical protein